MGKTIADTQFNSFEDCFLIISLTSDGSSRSNTNFAEK